jgi:hypothetical protein
MKIKSKVISCFLAALMVVQAQAMAGMTCHAGKGAKGNPLGVALRESPCGTGAKTSICKHLLQDRYQGSWEQARFVS